MDDQNRQAENVAPASGVEATPASETVKEAPQDTSPEQKPVEADQPKQEEAKKEAPKEEKKPTRSERRVHQLLDKLKDQKGQEAQNQTPPWLDEARKPLIDPQMAENGIDPNVLEQRFEAKRIADRELIKRELTAQSQRESAIKDHLSDVEKTQELLKDDPEFDELVAEQYDIANTDPFGNFIPRVKMSDIYNKMKKILDKKTVSAQADVSAKLAVQAEQTALQPSKGQSTKDYEDDALFNEAKDSGSTEKWAEVLKRRIKH